MPLVEVPEARAALVAGGITGRHVSHGRAKNIEKIHDLIEGRDPDAAFGLSGLEGYSAEEILGFMAGLIGCSPDPGDFSCEDSIDPDRTIDGLLQAGRRLKEAARRGHTLLAATGHPTGMLLHHIKIVEGYRLAGGKVLQLREEEDLGLGKRGRRTEVRYIGGVGCLADWGNLKHTHSAAPMEALLEEDPRPDLVLGDHGYAGAAIERGIPTIAVMDINDHALAIAHARGQDVVLVPMDDNRPPRLYEPAWSLIVQAMEAR